MVPNSFADRIRCLHDTLPGDRPNDIGEQARWFLRIPLELAMELPAQKPIQPDPRTCPNCGRLCDEKLSPYCDARCRESSSFVRQFRASLSAGVTVAPDKQIAFAQIVWHLMGGGLPYRNSLIPTKTLQRFLAKHDDQCAACGGVATTVDHIKTFCNRPINLRPMCDSCAVTKPFGHPDVMSRSQSIMKDLAQRIGNNLPLRCCDDQSTWDWRAFLRLRHAP